VGPPPTAVAAAELDLEVLETADVNDPGSLERIRAARPEVAAVCAFGQLIKESLLSELLMLNVHPSLLPRWRGAAPIERAILAGDTVTGVSVMQVTAGLDSGPVALQEETPIGHDEDWGTLSGRLAELGGELIVRALDRRAAGSLELVEQDDSRATYADKIDPAERRLDPARRAAELVATVRALNPHIGTYIELEGGDRLGVRRATATDGELAVGELVADGGLRLGCAEGVLRLDEVQPPGKRPMKADDYLRGHRPPSGVG
jgi:methionyl-tRNA formyltransferase